MIDDLRAHEERVYSDGGEDGVLGRIFERIGTRSRFFVEFGAWDGLHLSNTANLRLHHGWDGLLMEGDAPRSSSFVRNEFVTAENVEELFEKYGVPRDFDLLSIDIDGNDYWVWKALESFRPRVVVIEYNIFFAPEESHTIRYDPSHCWDRTTYHGASLRALQKLGSAKGYTLVYADSWAPNAFFVADEDLPAGALARPVSEITPWNRMAAKPDPLGREWLEV